LLAGFFEFPVATNSRIAKIVCLHVLLFKRLINQFKSSFAKPHNALRENKI